MTYRNESGEQTPIPSRERFQWESLHPNYLTWHAPDMIPLAKRYLDRRKVTREARMLLPIKARWMGSGAAIGFECVPHYFYERRITTPIERGRDWLPPGRKHYWFALRSESPCLVLVEGVFDEAGFSAVALHGQTVRWSELDSSKPLTILFDRDAILQAELMALEGAALGYYCTSESHKLRKKDPGATSPAKLRELLRAGLQELST